MHGASFSGWLKSASVALPILWVVVAVTSALAPLHAVAAVADCRGYRACNVAPYTTHGYDSSTNHTSYWNQYVGDNCTNYIAYLMISITHLPDRQPWSGSGNAYNWGVQESAITDATPSVGAVAWWKARYHGAGSLGHVAYVEAVTHHAIVVSEDSYPANGVTDYSGDEFDWRVIPGNSRRWPSGFIHFPVLDPPPSPPTSSAPTPTTTTTPG